MLSINFFLNFLLWCIVPAFYIYLGQDANWDIQNYHLYIPITLFEGSFAKDLFPSGIHSFFNPLVTLPAYFIHRIANYPTLSFFFGFLLASFQGLCGPIIFSISKKLLKASSLIAFICSLIGITGSFLLSEAGASFGDLTLAVLLLFAVLLICNSLDNVNSNKYKNLIIAWGIFGASCGIKFISVFILPLIFCLTIASIQQIKELSFIKKLYKLSSIIIIPTFISYFIFGLPGFIIAWQGTSKPFFPLFSSIFGNSPYFTCDNQCDQRFMAKTIKDIFIAPLRDFNSPESPARGEIFYKDARPMISFYFGWVVLFLFLFKTIIRDIFKNKDKLKSIINLNLPPIIWFQIGLFTSYVIWLKAAGIGRYSITFMPLLGISFLISIITLVNLTNKITLSRPFNSHEIIISSKITLFLMIFILTFSLVNTTVPNWGRVNFQTKWNSLKMVQYNSDKQKLIDINMSNLIPKNKAIVLLDKPLAWLKQYAPNQSYNYIKPGELTSLAIELVKENIIKNNQAKEFFVIGYENNGNFPVSLESNKLITTASDNFTFSTKSCTDYRMPLGTTYRFCEATLEDKLE